MSLNKNIFSFLLYVFIPQNMVHIQKGFAITTFCDCCIVKIVYHKACIAIHIIWSDGIVSRLLYTACCNTHTHTRTEHRRVD